MNVSPEGDRLALLLVNVSNNSYVIVFSISSSAPGGSSISGLRRKSARQEVLCVAKHEQCSKFIVSPRWNFMATVSIERQGQGQNEIQLWDLHSTKANAPVVLFKVRLYTVEIHLCVLDYISYIAAMPSLNDVEYISIAVLILTLCFCI